MESAYSNARYMTRKEFVKAHPEVTRKMMKTDPMELAKLFRQALFSSDVEVRLSLAPMFLDWGAEPELGHVNHRGKPTASNVLHGLAAYLIDPRREAVLFQRLFDAGVDPNAYSPRYDWALEKLLYAIHFNERDLAPVYDVWFAHPGLDFLEQKNVHGFCLWDKVWRCVMSYGVIMRAQSYMLERGLSIPCPRFRRDVRTDDQKLSTPVGAKKKGRKDEEVWEYYDDPKAWQDDQGYWHQDEPMMADLLYYQIANDKGLEESQRVIRVVASGEEARVSIVAELSRLQEFYKTVLPVEVTAVGSLMEATRINEERLLAE
jgi:hypothetical protein